MQVAPLHTPNEMRSISDLAHSIEGAILGLAALVALVQATGQRGSGGARLIWPGLILTAGIALLGYLLLPHHGLDRARAQWTFIFRDPQQRQHLVLAFLATVGGATELLYRMGRLRGVIWLFVWPAAVAVVGLMFAAHTQHGTEEAVARAVLIHRLLGILLIATGVFKAAETLWVARARWLAFPWTITLLAAAALLVLYREPEGAYSVEHGVGHEPNDRTDRWRPR